MERRFFLKIAMLSSLPIFSFGRMKILDIHFENDEKIKLNKPMVEESPEAVLEDFLNINEADKAILKDFVGPDVYMKRSKIRSTNSRRLKLYNPHTNETFNYTYFSNGRYKKNILNKLNYFLRDFREKKSKHMDVKLVDLLYSLQMSTSTTKPLTVLSGYRTRKTNEKLRRRLKGVAKNSFHIKGKATDICPSDNSRYKLKRIKHIAENKRIGGVGYYRKSGFVHVDTGPIRHWG